jgi:hypothetical protein
LVDSARKVSEKGPLIKTRGVYYQSKNGVFEKEVF